MALSTPRIQPAMGGEQSRGDRWAVWLLIGLSLLFAIVPDTLSMNNLGPEATHTIAQGSMLRQIEYGGLFLAAGILVLRHARTAMLNLRQCNFFLLGLMLYCLASATWSPFPDITLKRTIIFAGLILIGLAIAPPFSTPRQFLRVVMGTYTLICIVSFFVVLLFPSVGIDNFLGGAWRGITWQKNMLGSIAGFAAMLWLREWLMEPRQRRWSTLGILFSAFMLVMSRSATAVLVTALGTGLYLFTRRRWLGGRHSGQIILFGGIIVVLYGLLIFYVSQGRMPEGSDVVGLVTSLFNKSSDLTGRGQIWDLVEIAIRKHPVWGIGYSAFWVGEGGPAQYIANRMGWMPAHAHNGFLDILNDMGQVGMGLFLACLTWHCISLFRLFRVDREDAAMHLGICLTIMISNFSESQILRDTSFQNIMFICSSLAISGRLAAHRAAQRSAPQQHEQAEGGPRPSATGLAMRRQGHGV
ncbi:MULTISPECIES: O-antigen ligase [unclassified Achromobacter]|uniref:O-antigen ligase family protein n=1 Tax=unclassified Achromobacter TaxID=2626865 RepID=UPI000B51D5E3|nr:MULTISPECIES: O-antigen ligase family protein [unclassified Achromobacter]OWT74299.1 lipid A core--O-antigen ligase [Achromobacter sp. HZ34]OWT78766.1 lipid A core--O-antigen ligase [Achromobacter sp. HZ28]